MKNIQLYIENKELDYDASTGNFPITIDYAFEDTVDFQKKKGSEALDIDIPGTLKNAKNLNSFGTNAIFDITPDQKSKNIKGFRIVALGDEIFTGKVIPASGKKQHGIIKSYKINAFGGNSDWTIDLAETTFYDILKNINLEFSKANIVNSWNYDGRNENLPFVFAPVKYAAALDFENGDDRSYSMENMKPSMSVYWILIWGLQKAGYSVKSDFFDSYFFRRLVMPWTWGSFLTSEGTKYDIHKVEAKSETSYRIEGNALEGEINLYVTKELQDNNSTVAGGDYSYVNKRSRWTYNTPNFGKLKARFGIDLSYDTKVDMGSHITIYTLWFKNGIQVKQTEINYCKAPALGSRIAMDIGYDWCDFLVENTGDYIECSVYIDAKETNTATVCRTNLQVMSFTTEFFKIPEGGTVDFSNYLGLQKYKFLDFFRGIIDTFNLSLATDNSTKTICIEPTHGYSLTNDLSQLYSPGYFNGKTLDWTNIEDTEKESEFNLYSDKSREFTFKFKNDSSDGALKIVQDRNSNVLGSSKYVFSDRFKEKQQFENRFFAPTMHYFCNDFQNITGISPQLVCMVPENISNTSSGESQNTFEPKLCFYKGRTTGVGGWKFKDQKGNEDTYQDLPFMFAVNYQQGGENDIALSYSDEKIGTKDYSPIVPGLMKRFYMQRLAIMNHGVWDAPYFKLKNSHIKNWFHRENIVIKGIRYELINIKSFNPNSNDSSNVTLRQWVPVSQRDYDYSFPSLDSIKTGKVTTGDKSVYDMVYSQLICLYGDIPRDTNS